MIEDSSNLDHQKETGIVTLAFDDRKLQAHKLASVSESKSYQLKTVKSEDRETLLGDGKPQDESRTT